jgi:sec-independent protein translocase protein TatA
LFGLLVISGLGVIFGLGPTELIIILVIVLLIFGSAAIPKLGKAIGETIRGLRDTSKEIEKGSDKEEKEPAKKEKTKSSATD